VVGEKIRVPEEVEAKEDESLFAIGKAR